MIENVEYCQDDESSQGTKLKEIDFASYAKVF